MIYTYLHALANLAINLVVTDAAGNTELSLDGGKIQKGLADNAKTTLNMDAETLRKVFLEFDMAAAMQAFMTGKIKVQGDMSQLMALQTAKPSQDKKTYLRRFLSNLLNSSDLRCSRRIFPLSCKKA